MCIFIYCVCVWGVVKVSAIVLVDYEHWHFV